MLAFGLQAMALASIAEAAPASTVIAEATPHDRLLSIDFDGTRGIAVGAAGRIMVTGDGGNKWTLEKAVTRLELMAAAIHGQREIVVGQMGLIMVRDRGGEWTKVDSGSKERLLQVDLGPGGLAFATGAFGTLLKSTDAGNSWTALSPEWGALYNSDDGPVDASSMAVKVTEPTNYIVRVLDDGAVLLGGEYGALLRSDDAGDNWSMVYRHPKVDGAIEPTLFSLRMRPDGIGYAVGQSGLVVRTADGGRTWQRCETPVEASLFGVASDAAGEVAVVGQRVGLYSADDGRSWKTVDALDLGLNWYADVARADSGAAGEFVVVGHGGRIVRLAPGADTHNKQTVQK